MHCTDRNNRMPGLGLTRLLLVATFALLSACVSVDEKTGQSAGAASAAVSTPNPYLQQEERVPQAAREKMEKARVLHQSGDQTAAAKMLRSITEEWPELSGPWLNLGILQAQLDDSAAAEASFRSAIDANDNNVFAWNQLAALLREDGQFAEAQAHYRAALDRWPDYGDAHRNLGILLDLYLHQPEEALMHYRKAQALEEEPDRQLTGWIVDLERRLQ